MSPVVTLLKPIQEIINKIDLFPLPKPYIDNLDEDIDRTNGRNTGANDGSTTNDPIIIEDQHDGTASNVTKAIIMNDLIKEGEGQSGDSTEQKDKHGNDKSNETKGTNDGDAVSSATQIIDLVPSSAITGVDATATWSHWKEWQ